jgi:hypothetical protein
MYVKTVTCTQIIFGLVFKLKILPSPYAPFIYEPEHEEITIKNITLQVYKIMLHYVQHRARFTSVLHLEIHLLESVSL